MSSFRNERGVALLIVITILVTMVIVAVPFAMSMRQGQERTESVAARSRAQYEAGLLSEIVKLFLVTTHPNQEQKRFLATQASSRRADTDPTVDSIDEITPDDRFRKQLEEQILTEWAKDPRLAAKARYLKSRGLGPLNDDRGSIWTVRVQDAQALVNVNGSSPFLLANMLGSALLSDDLDTGGGDIAVEHVATGRFGGFRGFPRDGGYIRIGREVIRYESFDGGVFRGCERGALLDTPLRDNGPAAAHEQGDAVIDYTAYKIATHIIADKPGFLAPFQNLEDVRSIATWGEAGVIPASRLERVLPYLTAWSRREMSSGWLASQLAVNPLPESVDGNAAEEVRLRDLQNNPSGTTAYFNAGTLVRLTDGVSTVYQSVTGVGDVDGKSRHAYVTLAGRANAVEQDLQFKGGEARIEAMVPYPININTAPREVLYAVMANIGLWRAKGKDQVVTPELAWSLAGEIVESRKGPMRGDVETGKRQSGPFRHAEDFGRFLESKVRSNELKRAHFQALYTNAINPHDFSLRFGTAPWCYRTLDVYHVESRVAVNNRAGEQIAEAGLREVVEIGSDDTATWVLDSQEDFEQRLAMGSGAKWVTTYPFAVAYKSRKTHHIQPALRGPKGYLHNVYPSATRNEDLGDVRLEPARMLLEGAEVVEHFDPSWYADGHFTGYDGAYTRKTAGTFMSKGDTWVRPFTMSFWWRPYSNADWTVFDAGMEQFMNRFAVFVQQGDTGQELTFRCCAGNLAQQGAEVYVPLEQLDYERGNWYHIHVSCDGEDPSTMQMLVDGVDIGRRRGFTYLSGSITADSTDIAVESTDGFPVRGAIRIGDEIIEYDTRSARSFRDCIRGARGSNPTDADGVAQAGGREWPRGTPVHLLGYSMPITVDIMRGGRHLDEALRKWSCVRISTLGGGSPAPDSVTITIGDSEWVLGGFGPDTRDMTCEVVGMWGQPADQGYDAFNTKGIAMMGSHRVDVADTGDVKIGGWELVYYERQGATFTIERYVETKWQDASDEYFLVTENRTANTEFPAFLIPISVLAAGSSAQGEDYLDPGDSVHEEKLLRYYPDGDASARVLLGTDSPQDQHEIIRYDSIDRDRAAPHMLFVRDRNLGSIGNHFFDEAQPLGDPPSSPDDPTPDPDDPPPVPDDDDPPPVPGDGGGGFDPGDNNDPRPGDGVPPGQRDPDGPDMGGDDDGGGTVPVPDDGGFDDGGDDGGGLEPGGDDPLPDSDGGQGGADDGGFEEPGGGDDGGGLEPGGEDPLGEGDSPQSPDGAGDGSFDGGEEGGGGLEGGGEDPAAGGTPPPPEEPAPDESGGGGDFGSDEGDGGGASPGDGSVPDIPPPADPGEDTDADENGNTEPDSGVWEPSGPQTAMNLLPFRGVNGGPDGGYDHSAGNAGDDNALFLPCFRVWEGWSGRRLRAGRNDVITIHAGGDSGAKRIERGVRWADESDSIASRVDWMALTDFVDQVFVAPEEGARTGRNEARGRPRILKFPCGELPDEMSSQIEFGQSAISGSGLVTAFLDELFVYRHAVDARLTVVNSEGVNEETKEIYLQRLRTDQDIESLAGYYRDCGVACIEGELVVFRGARLEGRDLLVLEDCARGQFGTKPAFHGRLVPARLIPDIPVSYLDTGLNAEASSIPVARTKDWPREGLVRILRDDTAELVHYTRRGERELLMPVSLDADERTRDRGLFRGRFGTEPIDHDNGAIVVWQPFRYWDRYAGRRDTEEDNAAFTGVHDHPDASYLELGKKARSALWRGFTWTENLLGRQAARDDASADREGVLDIVVLARFSPNVPWDTTNIVDLSEEDNFGTKRDLASKARDHVFYFDDVGSTAMGPDLEGNLLGVESDTAEFRVYFVYKPNAFDPVDNAGRGSGNRADVFLTNSWKLTPWLRSFHVNYYTRTHTRYRAPLR